MKKLALLAAIAAFAAAPAFAADEVKTTTTATTTTTAPVAAAQKIELKDGSWAEVQADGAVKVSKDGGKTWVAAPDGTWETKAGAKIVTHGGKAAK